MASKTALGRWAEAQGLEWITQQLLPCRIVAKNFRVRGGEIDFILEQELHPGHVELVFVEVRYRKNESMVAALESLDSKKLQKMKHAANQFLARYRRPAKSLRYELLFAEGCAFGHLTWQRLELLSWD